VPKADVYDTIGVDGVVEVEVELEEELLLVDGACRLDRKLDGGRRDKLTIARSKESKLGILGVFSLRSDVSHRIGRVCLLVALLRRAIATAGAEAAPFLHQEVSQLDSNALQTTFKTVLIRGMTPPSEPGIWSYNRLRKRIRRLRDQLRQRDSLDDDLLTLN